MRELAAQLQAFYARLSTVQTGVLIGSILAALAGFATLFLWSSEPEFRPLFTNLTPEDAAAIVNQQLSNASKSSFNSLSMNQAARVRLRITLVWQ